MTKPRIKVDYDVEEKHDIKKKKRKYSSEDSETSSSSSNSYSKKSDSGSSSSYSSKMTKRKKKKEKHLKKKTLQKSLKKKLKKCKKKKKLKNIYFGSSKKTSNEDLSEEIFGPPVPTAIESVTKRMAPLTKEQWESQQSIVRRVLDEETGRMRLIKGDGEVMEEIVSRDRHKNINRQATIKDGNFFQNKIGKII